MTCSLVHPTNPQHNRVVTSKAINSASKPLLLWALTRTAQHQDMQLHSFCARRRDDCVRLKE
jgi:hypothetical protein